MQGAGLLSLAANSLHALFLELYEHRAPRSSCKSVVNKSMREGIHLQATNKSKANKAVFGCLLLRSRGVSWHTAF